MSSYQIIIDVVGMHIEIILGLLVAVVALAAR